MIALLEDDANIRQLVLYALGQSGLEAEGYERPSELYAAMKKRKMRLLLLDVMLPEEDGIEVLKKLRARPETARLPVILLTAKSTEYDRVLGLDSGADDYVTKPFSMLELLSRIRALLRRAEAQEKTEFEMDALSISISRREVRVKGAPVQLTYKEFELLHLLASHQEKVLTRERILQDIWGIDFDGENRTVDVHIRTLRSKLGECGGWIETIRGVGYRLCPKAEGFNVDLT